MSARNTRSKINLCNLIIALLCAAAVFAYFLFPLWRVKVSYPFTAEALQEIVQETAAEGSEDTSSEDGETQPEDIVKDTLSFDPQDILGEEGVTLTLGITIRTTDVFAALFNANEQEVIQGILETNVDDMVDQILAPMNKIVKGVARSASKTALKDAVHDQVKAFYGEKTDEEVKQILSDAGVTDEYIDAEADKLLEKMEKGESIEVISNDVIASVENVLEKLNAKNAEFPKTLSPTTQESIKNSLESSLNTISNEDGTINMDEFVADLILNAIGGASESETAESKNAALSDTQTTSKTQQLKTELKSLFMEQIPPETAKTIASTLRYVCFFLLFTFFTWLYLIIKILAKRNNVNNSIKLKAPILLGCLPCWILCLIPNIAIFVVGRAAGADMLGGASLSFFSASIVSFIIGVFFCVFTIAYYGKLRKRIKQIASGAITERDDSNAARLERQRREQLHEAALSDDAYVKAYGTEAFEEDYDNDNSYE